MADAKTDAKTDEEVKGQEVGVLVAMERWRKRTTLTTRAR